MIAPSSGAFFCDGLLQVADHCKGSGLNKALDQHGRFVRGHQSANGVDGQLVNGSPGLQIFLEVIFHTYRVCYFSHCDNKCHDPPPTQHKELLLSFQFDRMFVERNSILSSRTIL